MKWTQDKRTLAIEIISAAPSLLEGYRRVALKLGTTPAAVMVAKGRGLFGDVEAATAPPEKITDTSADLRKELVKCRAQLEVVKGLRVKAPAPVVPVRKPSKCPPKGRIHVVIGDTQAKPGAPTRHLTWIGRYIADQFVGQDVVIVHVGDHWDMPSLSSYDEGKKEIEGKRYVEDVRAGNEAFALLDAPIAAAMKAHRWRPERHFLFGNHEDRITRACNDTAVLDGALSLDDLDTRGWVRHPFLTVVDIDGISYAHYFYHPNTGRAYGGENLLPRLKTIGRSFTMGHQQGTAYTLRAVGARRQHGLVLGSSYLHDEKYHGPQVMAYWRGIVVCHQVEDGQYDPMFVSLDYLCRRYEGKTLAQWRVA